MKQRLVSLVRGNAQRVGVRSFTEQGNCQLVLLLVHRIDYGLSDVVALLNKEVGYPLPRELDCQLKEGVNTRLEFYILNTMFSMMPLGLLSKHELILVHHQLSILVLFFVLPIFIVSILGLLISKFGVQVIDFDIGSCFVLQLDFLELIELQNRASYFNVIVRLCNCDNNTLLDYFIKPLY